MNETRKKIIELIEPYMDKVLSEGCIIFYKDTFYALGDKYSIEKHKGESFLYGKYEGRITDDDYKILGHYGITAVLKYIYYNGYKEGDTFIGENYFHFTDLGLIKVPNKPLHLYTEQEEKDLLELLNKLGT